MYLKLKLRGWIELIWNAIGTGNTMLSVRRCTFGFNKIQGIV